MLKTIELKNIKPNPFNARSDYAEKPINELAKEIEKSGFWGAALRGRNNNGKVELCFGHRRLAALKKLGHKEVQIEIVDLSDEEMAMQGLAENLQREGLNDMEKAAGIKCLVEQLAAKGMSKDAGYEKVATMLGYESTAWIKALAGITEYTAPVKKLISEKKVSAKVAIRAHGFGGDEMVKTAAQEQLSLHTITKLSQSLQNIPDENVREKIRAKVITGDITDPREIDKKAEPLLRAKSKKGEPPPDLLIVIARWTASIKEWRKALREVVPYRDYLDTSPRIAKEFRAEVSGLIAELEKLL